VISRVCLYFLFAACILSSSFDIWHPEIINSIAGKIQIEGTLRINLAVVQWGSRAGLYANLPKSTDLSITPVMSASFGRACTISMGETADS